MLVSSPQTSSCAWGGNSARCQLWTPTTPRIQPLDPQTAEAVEQVEVPEDQVGQVQSELQKGYSFQGRVIRPSRVRVGVAKKTEH